ILVDRSHPVARMERNKCLAREFIDCEALRVDTEDSVSRHNRTNAASGNNINRTSRRHVGEARKTQTAKAFRNDALMSNERCRDSLVRKGIRDEKVSITTI